tara:strand:+ start:1146 stop:1778 length:633 start_codon:yes stop_codon:yes gene_type:complete
MNLVTASVIVLWIVVIALVVVILALARQVGVLYERVAPAGALMVNQQLKPGDKAPQIEVLTIDNSKLSVGLPNQLLFFLAPDCPICKTLLPILKNLQKSEKDIDFVLISDGDDDHEKFVNEQELTDFPYTVTETVGRSFGVGKLPYGVLTDENGVISSLGIVNSREHLESLFEARKLGVGSIQEYLEKNSSESENSKSSIQEHTAEGAES